MVIYKNPGHAIDGNRVENSDQGESSITPIHSLLVKEVIPSTVSLIGEPPVRINC